ncbi:MAG: helix-turn-helix domain-containing protein [Spirochaetaceae bacterium]|jgi:AraC-like DNA-binding protein/ligand-binding sensor protein|nr:helix-turn-helix domain-containing protein [Spirochaetaceae bacterium]
MQENTKTATPPIVPSKTDPLLIKAYAMLKVYAQATGTMISVYDRHYLPIPEVFDAISDKIICLPCPAYRRCQDVQDYTPSPCTDMHIHAIKEAKRFGGSYIYMCEVGFMFWTSPLYGEDRFVGALLGGGLLGLDPQEASAQLYLMGNGEVPLPAIKEKLAVFPQGEAEQIKALSELMLLFAKSLSEGSEHYYETLKRRSKQQSILSAKIKELRVQYPPGTPAPGYPLDKERMLLAALRRGDHETGRKILNELLAILLFANLDQFKYLQFRAIELVVLLSRTNMVPGTTEKVLLETNNQYLKRIQNAQSIEELTDILHAVVEHLGGQIFSFQGLRHASALRKAERYIGEHYTRKISLQEIARVSGLSAPYFSTIFKVEMGENLSSYINRLRVERACHMLVETDISLSEIAGACGFEDQSWFSKIFKTFIGVSPGKYRSQGGDPTPDLPRLSGLGRSMSGESDL